MQKSIDSNACILAEYGYPADCPYSADGVIIFCKTIWAAAHNDLKTLIEISTCGNMSAFARTHNIPIRTMQDWIGGKRVPSEYIMQFLGYAVIGGIPEEE